MTRAIMIFGGSLNQLGLVLAAKELGLVSVLVDPSENPLGKKYADHFYQIPAADFDATRAIALRHRVAGIVTGQMERPLKLMARLAQELKLIFHSPEVVERATNKYLEKNIFQAKGIPCAKGDLIKNHRILSEEEIFRFGNPAIIKPLSRFSSQGVFRVENYSSYVQNLDRTLGFSENGSYLFEEFIAGPEFSAECLSYRGETRVIQFTRKLITAYPNTVEIGHIQPAELSESQKKEIEDLVIRSVASLGIDNSASHVEFKISESGPKIIEIGPRTGGDFIGSFLTLESTGVNMDKAVIQVALGEEPDWSPNKDRGSAIRYLTLEPGSQVLDIAQNWRERVLSLPGVLEAQLLLETGESIPQLTDSAKRRGWVIASGNDAAEAEAHAEEALTALGGCIQIKKRNLKDVEE